MTKIISSKMTLKVLNNLKPSFDWVGVDNSKTFPDSTFHAYGCYSLRNEFFDFMTNSKKPVLRTWKTEQAAKQYFIKLGYEVR